MTKGKNFTINHLKESIVIVIEPDGTHHVKLPEDDCLEVSAKAARQCFGPVHGLFQAPL